MISRAPSEGKRKRGSGQAESYDFRQPMTLTREHARALELSFQMFGRLWGTMLSSRLGALTTITLDSVQLCTYDEYIQSLPHTTTMAVFHTEPSRTPTLLNFPTDTTLMLVDCLLGGPVAKLDMPFRELTEIEWSLMREMLDHATNELTYGFASIMPLKLDVRTVKYNPQFMQVVAATEPVLVARFEMVIGGEASQISFMFVAEPILAELRAGESDDSRTEEEQAAHNHQLALMMARAHEIPLPVSIRFRSRTMEAGDVSDLEVGSVIPLFHPSAQPLDVVVGDVTLAHAAIGVNGTRVACLVVSSQED